MAVSDYLPLVVALVLAILTGLRTPAAVRGKNVPLWGAHVLITVLLLLAVTPIYLAVDGILGGTNVANLLVHILISLVFLALTRQVAQSVARPDVARRISWLPGLPILVLTSALVTLFFVLADTPRSSMGLNLYQDDPWVVAYRAATLLYPAYCSALLVPALYSEVRDTDTPTIHRVAKGCLMTGFALVIPVPVLTLLEYVNDSARTGVDIFTYLAIMLVALGPLLAFTARKRRGQGSRRLAA